MKRFFVISAIGVLTVFLCPVSGYSVQYGRPIADVTNVNWTVAPLWEKLDEVVSDDAVTEIDTYITAVPALAYFTVKLSPVTDPQSADNHVIRYRAHYSSRNGSASMRGYLYQGDTLISAEPGDNALTTAQTTYSWTLSTEEASSITDYDDLKLKLEVVNPVPSVRVYNTWLELEVPDVQPINWSDWAYKMKIRFRGYTKPTTLKSFPVLIVLNESIPDFRYRQFESPAGNDLRFTDAQTNELNYEIESWDTNGSSYVWVQMPSLVDSNDYIYARWGNEIETTPPGYTADGTVWTNGYAGVWHLDEKTGIHYDSTENNNNGTPYNGVDQDEPGQIDGADKFDGLNDTVKVLDSASLDVSSKLTISAWFKLNDWNRQAAIARKTASYRFYNRDMGSGSGPYAMTLKLKGVTPEEANHAASNYSNGQWYYCVGTYDSAGGANNLKLYRNGVQVAATTASGSITVSADDLYFGSKDGIEDRFPGIIDEVRVCGVTRSADWIWACWLNQASNTVFCEFAPIDGVALPPEISNSGGATGITHNSAFLNGNLLSRGGTNSYAFVYWGDTDQATNKLLWATTINMGLVTEGAFSTNVTGLIPNKPYYYRCRATNVYGEGWAGSSSCFTSLAPVVQFTAASSSGAESVSPVNIQLQLSDPSTHWQDVSVNYAVIGGTASNGVDYMLAAGTATISIGNTTTNITLTVTNDTMDEYDETIIIRLSSPVNGRLSGNTNHTYTIQDDDAEPTVLFVNTPLMAWENCTNAVIGVMLSEQSARTVSVDYATSPGTAVSPDDYTNMSGTLTWSPGESGIKTYAVPVVNDTDQEGGETFTNTLSAPFNCTIAGINPAAMVIVDDDLGAPMLNNGAGVIDILMNSAVMSGNLVATGGVPTQVWVCWGTSDGGTNAGSWINKTLINISGLGTFSTNITGLPANTLHHYRACASNEYGTSWGEETISFYTGPPTVQFYSTALSGLESTDQLWIQLELSDPAVYGANVSVNYAVTGGTASNGVDYTLAAGTAVITAGKTTTNILVTITNDIVDEFDETFTVSLSSPVNGELGSKTNYTYTIIDDDEAPEVSFEGTPYTVDETAGNKIISIALSQIPGKTTSVDFATANWTAFDGQDYTNTSGTLTWVPGESGSKTFSVPIVNDAVQMGDIMFLVTLSGTNNCVIGGNATTNVVILDDEVTPPSVSNGDGVTNILWTTATLRGRIVDDGGLDCQGYFYWGASDGVTNEAAWSNKVETGSQFGDFETEIEGMVANRAYYYRCAAENNRGQSWAGATLVFTTLQAQVSGGVNYYVNDSSTVGDLYCTAVGNDGNGGTTPGAPKATLQNLISTKALAAGDCVWVDTGIYNMASPVMVTSADAGSSSKKVTFRGATGNAGTVLDVNDPAKYVVYLFMANYVRLENLRLRKGQCGVFVYYCTGSDVVNCHSYSNSEHGVFAYFSGGGTIADNKCYKNQLSGIIIGAGTGPFVISGNECYEQKENAGIAVQNTDITIVNNTCYDNAAEGILVEVTSSTPVVLTNNECFYNTKAGIDVMCLNMEAIGNRLYYNGTFGIITDNTGQHTFRNNVGYWNGSYSFYIQGSPIKALVRHNTVYGGNGIYINDPGRVTNDNNVVWAVGGGNRAVYMKYAPGGSDVCLSDYNNLYASGGAHAGRWDTNECATLDDWKTYSSRDAGSISADPLFVNSGSGDMHLKSVAGSYHNGGWWGDEANSPSIDAGDPLSASFTNEPDYNGITLNQGAYGGTWQASMTYYTGPFYSIFLAVDPSSDDGWATVNPSQMLTVPTNSYPTNRAVLVEAGVTDGRYYKWSHWTGDFSSTNNPATFYVTGDMNVTAVLERVTYSIQTIPGPNGTIDPTGTVSVAAGSNITFSILADPTYQVSNVTVDAVSIGATNSYTFVNVLTNHTIQAVFEAERYQLTVSTEHGTATPSGSAWYDYGSNVSCRLSGAPVTNGLIRYECTGWKGTGSVSEGSGTNTVVTITNTSTLAWQWRTNFWLSVAASSNGSVDTASNWQWAGTNASILAIPTNGYTFAGWTGDTNSMSNPLTLTMYRAYSVTANFEYGGSFIIATAHDNGTIAPNGFIPVENGADTNFVITANDHCYIVDVEVDGSSIGITNAYTFENVTTNHTIEAWFAIETRQLIVNSDHDKASPSGTNLYDYGTYVTCSITGTPVTVGDTRYDCTGREGTGSAPSGSGTNFGFNITNDSTVKWLWSTNYMLNISLSGSGSVNFTNGWKNDGTNINIQATPSNGYHFIGWTGDTNTTANPLDLTMNQGYSLTGTFEINMYTITVSAVENGSISPSGMVAVTHGADTNFVITADDGYVISNVVVDGSSVGTPDNYMFSNVTNNHTISAVFQFYASSAKGTPIWWLEKYGFTNNYDVADTNDQDFDGAFTWQEYLAGTIPTNPLSTFVILNMGRQGGSNYVRWFGTTNSGVYTDFLMYRSTGLIYGGWSLIESNLSRSGTGINEWWDDDPPGSKVFYRPALPPTNQ